MSVSEQITLLANSKQAIKNSINAKGGSITDSTPFADYSTAIDNLPSGGDNSTLIDLIERNITSINIPSGTTSIGAHAFSYCSNLTSVTIPSSVTQILSGAFYQCTGLVSITMPNSVNYIQDNVFYGCTSLTSVVISSGITILQQGLFHNCTSLTSVTIPSSVTSIGESVFRGCLNLTSVSIPSSVTSIGQRAFNSCSGLQYLVFNPTTPPTLSNTNALQNTNDCPLFVPASALDTYKTASNWSTYADRIQAIPEDVKPAFKFTSSVDSSKDVTVNCEDTKTAGTLTANDLGMSSQQIDEFRSAENTGSVEIGDCVKIYMAAACYTAKGISEVILNEGLESIEDFAFGGMSALTEITIPSTVTNISYQAFYADRALTSITCLATTPPTLGSDVFGDTNNCPIYVPAESVDAYKTAWSQYADRLQAIPAE